MLVGGVGGRGSGENGHQLDVFFASYYIPFLYFSILGRGRGAKEYECLITYISIFYFKCKNSNKTAIILS